MHERGEEGVKLEVQVLLTETGCERLDRFPLDLVPEALATVLACSQRSAAKSRPAAIVSRIRGPGSQCIGADGAGAVGCDVEREASSEPPPPFQP